MYSNSDDLDMEIKIHRNAVKMYAFLLNWITMLHEQNQSNTVKEKGKKKGRKKEENTDSEWKERLVKVFNNTLEHDYLGRLWKMDKPEETFLLLFYKTAFILLENPQNVKHKSLKEGI